MHESAEWTQLPGPVGTQDPPRTRGTWVCRQPNALKTELAEGMRQRALPLQTRQRWQLQGLTVGVTASEVTVREG